MKSTRTAPPDRSDTATPRKNGRRAIIGALAGGVLTLMSPQPSGAEGAGPSATGSAHLTVADELTTFTFNVKQLPSGEVVGQAQRQSRSLDATLHYDLNCLRVVGTNRAIIGGTLTHSDVPRFAEGLKVIFNVVDNGEGAKDADDQLSGVILFTRLDDPRNCTNFEVPNRNAGALRPIEHGNIQVRP